jgi:Bacterial Ig domain/Chitobiase/beta-hexosaminidase C-terminal domain
VGTGGQGLDIPGQQLPTSEAVDKSTHGVLRMTLLGGSYTWAFVPDEASFTDSGSYGCSPAKAPPPDTTPPTTSITCNSVACSSGWYSAAPVSIHLSATDNDGGSGVASTHYTTDGTDPDLSSPTYAAPFDVGSTTTVNFRSWDNAGNAESVNTQLVRIDAAAPQVSVKSPANGSSFARRAKVKIHTAAVDRGTGGAPPSGVTGVVFYLDGSTVLGSASAAPYKLTWKVKRSVPLGQHTLTAVATDAAGNATTSAPISITITA